MSRTHTSQPKQPGWYCVVRTYADHRRRSDEVVEIWRGPFGGRSHCASVCAQTFRDDWHTISARVVKISEDGVALP